MGWTCRPGFPFEGALTPRLSQADLDSPQPIHWSPASAEWFQLTASYSFTWFLDLAFQASAGGLGGQGRVRG